MQIELLDQFSFTELKKRIRSVPLLNNKEVFVYSQARIDSRVYHPLDLNITKLAFLKENISFQKELREYLLNKYKVDTLNLKGGINLLDKDTKQEWTMIPPIVELVERRIKYIPVTSDDIEHSNHLDIKIPLVADGGHRAFLAKELKLPLRVVFISNVNQKYPFYAHPNSWDLAKLVEIEPPKESRKFFVRADSYSLYRDFSVLGMGGVRKEGSKKY